MNRSRPKVSSRTCLASQTSSSLSPAWTPGHLASFSCRQNLLADCLQGCLVVACSLCAFISLVWLREQIVHGGAPQWLEQNPPPRAPNGPAPADQVSASPGHPLLRPLAHRCGWVEG